MHRLGRQLDLSHDVVEQRQQSNSIVDSNVLGPLQAQNQEVRQQAMPKAERLKRRLAGSGRRYNIRPV